ncbi:MAG TPA: MBL fold metallo-hydrolase, partial [Anaerolineae bacterium]|nr:MBL fold metallo-hydrolase [Anaerolineae bacterium]
MVKITCVTENSALRGSPFWAEHGLSFWIETDQGCVLFDTGQTASILLHNLALLGKSLLQINALVLSHAHNDHTGGLPVILSRRPGLPLYAAQDLGRPRFSHKEGRYRFIGLPLTMEALTQIADLRLSAEPAEVLPGVWTTGEIPERPEPEGRSLNHFVLHDDGWQPDLYRDDLAMVLETREGLVVICGCCHAGLLNTLAHIRQKFQSRIVALLGGTHLESSQGAALQHIVSALREYGPLRLYPNHCSGERAYVALVTAFGDRVQPCPAG